MKKIRTFVCIDFPDNVIKEVARIQNLIQNNFPFTGKLTELENLHLTLKFLGEIDNKTLNNIKQKLSVIKSQTLKLKLSSVGTFLHKSKPKIVWIKITGKIFQLQKEIDESLSDLFPKEERFMSHLTMVRIKYVKDKIGFINYIKNIKPKPLSFNVNSFKLSSSELKPQGPVYTTLEEYSLKSTPPLKIII